MPSRRALLAGVAAGTVGGLAGCASTGRTDEQCGTESPDQTTRGVERALGTPLDLPSDAAWSHQGYGPANTQFNPDAAGPPERATLRWTAVTEAPERTGRARAAPVLDGGTVFLVDAHHRLVALDAATGEARWTDASHPSRLPVTAVDGTVYLGNTTGTHAFDPDRRETVWSFEPPGLGELAEGTPTDRGSPRPVDEDATDSPHAPGSEPYMTTPRVTDDAVYGGVYTFDGPSRVYALDRATGERRWHATGHDVAAVGGGTVYVYDRGTVRAVAASDGRVRWEKGGIADAGSLAVGDGTVYAPAGVGAVAAYDAATGERRWRFEGETESMGVPAVGPERVYVGTSPTEGRDGGNLYALDPGSGDLEWCRFLGWESVGRPAVAGDAVFAAHSGGLVLALDPADGELRWRFYREHGWFDALAVAGDALLAGTEDGELYAFGPAAGR